nr:MAG TPA: hypothetical protein [Caudoviricetes sp.]
MKSDNLLTFSPPMFIIFVGNMRKSFVIKFHFSSQSRAFNISSCEFIEFINCSISCRS